MSSVPFSWQDNAASVEAGAVVAERTAVGQRPGGAAGLGHWRDVVLALAAVGPGHGQGGGLCSARAAADGQLARPKAWWLTWARGLVEGAKVKKGDFILEIQPTAANLVEQLKAQLQDLKTKLATAQTKVEVYQQNIEDFAAARDFAVQAAQEMVKGARGQTGGQARRRARLRSQGMANPASTTSGSEACSRKA